MARLSQVVVVWDGVVGASGYHIMVDGAPVAKTGAKARSARVAVTGDSMLVEVVDLPDATLAQGVRLDHRDATLDGA